MAKIEPYGIEKDLNILKGKSGKHSARLEGQFMGLMPVSEFPMPVSDGKHHRRKEETGAVIDPAIYIDLDATDLAEDRNLVDMVLSVFGLEPKEADFDVFIVMDKVLRALAKAKFKNLASLELNGKTVYEHPEKEMDLKDVLEHIKDYILADEKIEEAKALVIEKAEGDTQATVTVDNVHTQMTHDIKIKIKGDIEEEYLNRIINYLEDNLEIEKLIEH
ncbi:MAG: hypothetical protein ACMUIG_02805 [Thermoplasmatota archaeon]